MIQVPQFILDHMWGKGETCKIVCTQPRRISATSGWHLMPALKDSFFSCLMWNVVSVHNCSKHCLSNVQLLKEFLLKEAKVLAILLVTRYYTLSNVFISFSVLQDHFFL